MESGQLIWVYEERTAEIFSMFLKQLPNTAKRILAVTMDVEPAKLDEKQQDKLIQMIRKIFLYKLIESFESICFLIQMVSRF